MTTYRWVGAHPYRDHRTGRLLAPGETFTDERIAEAHPHDCERVSDTPSDQPASLPFDPGTLTVAELRDALSERAADLSAADFDAIADAERNGKARTTALEAITAARDEDNT